MAARSAAVMATIVSGEKEASAKSFILFSTGINGNRSLRAERMLDSSVAFAGRFFCADVPALDGPWLHSFFGSRPCGRCRMGEICDSQHRDKRRNSGNDFQQSNRITGWRYRTPLLHGGQPSGFNGAVDCKPRRRFARRVSSEEESAVGNPLQTCDAKLFCCVEHPQ